LKSHRKGILNVSGEAKSPTTPPLIYGCVQVLKYVVADQEFDLWLTNATKCQAGGLARFLSNSKAWKER